MRQWGYGVLVYIDCCAGSTSILYVGDEQLIKPCCADGCGKALVARKDCAIRCCPLIGKNPALRGCRCVKRNRGGITIQRIHRANGCDRKLYIFSYIHGADAEAGIIEVGNRQAILARRIYDGL